MQDKLYVNEDIPEEYKYMDLYNDISYRQSLFHL